MENYISANPTEKYIAQNDSGLEELKNSGKLDFGEKVYVIESGETKIMGNDGNIYNFYTPSSSASPTPTPTPVDDGYVLVATQHFTAYDVEHPEVNEQENEDFASAIAENMPIDSEIFDYWCSSYHEMLGESEEYFTCPGLIKMVVQENDAVYSSCGDTMDSIFGYNIGVDNETGEFIFVVNISFIVCDFQCGIRIHPLYDAETGDTTYEVLVDTPIQPPVDNTVSFYMKSSHREA